MLSIIIVHYDTAGELSACLESLSSIPSWIEVIVVDNHSPLDPKDARKIVDIHPQMRWVDLESNVGFGRGVHHGVEVSRGEKLFILNPDSSIVDADWDAFSDAIEEDVIICADLQSAEGKVELPGWFSPGLFSEVGRSIVQGRIDRGFDWPARLMRKQGLSQRGLSWVTGAALAMTRKRWDKLGGFDPAFFLFFEDIDLCLRHRRGGGRCRISHHVTVVHARGVASGRHSEFAESHYRRSQELFWNRHGSWWSRRWMRLINRIQRRRRTLRYHWRKSR